MKLPSEEDFNRELKFTDRLCIVLTVVCLLLMLMLSGCRSVTYVPVETVTHDSIYFNKVQHDSVYLKEYINVFQKADTVYKEKTIVKYKEKISVDTLYVTKIDSVYQERIVKVEKPLTKWQRTQMGMGRIFLGIIIGLLLWLIIYHIVKSKK